MRLIRRLKCWVFGHDLNVFWDEPCFRCERWVDGDAYTSGVITRAKMRWWWIKQWWRKKSGWFRPCEDCGKRFGRHDDTVEHIPF